MTLKAILSDVHSGLEAFTVVLKDIRNRGIEEIMHLGDLVGYGPDPKKVVRLAQKYGVRSVLGNHDANVCNKHRNLLSGFNGGAIQSDSWTRQQFQESGLISLLRKIPLVKERVGQNEIDYLKSMPVQITEDGVVYVHGCPARLTNGKLGDGQIRLALNEYATVTYDDLVMADDTGLRTAFQELIAMGIDIGFVGHYHRAEGYRLAKGSSIFHHEEIEFNPEEPIQLDEDKFIYVFDPGSVGQPRVRREGIDDLRAGYLVFDDEERTVTFFKMDYPVDVTAAKIRKTDGTPNIYANLIQGYPLILGKNDLKDFLNCDD
ncbi:metallophosphoesterase family protein [Nanoarchaeota archaeon]